MATSMAAAIAASMPAAQTAAPTLAPTYEAIPPSMSKVIDIEAEIPLSNVQLDGLVSTLYLFILKKLDGFHGVCSYVRPLIPQSGCIKNYKT